MIWRTLSTALALSCLAIAGAAGTAQANTGDIIAPQNTPPTASDGWQAGTCTLDTALTPCTPETTSRSSSPRRRGTRRSG